MKKDSIKPNLLILLVIHSSRAQGAADKAFFISFASPGQLCIIKNSRSD